MKGGTMNEKRIERAFQALVKMGYLAPVLDTKDEKPETMDDPKLQTNNHATFSYTS